MILCVEFTVLAQLLSLKEHENKQARLVAAGIGWADASILARVFDHVMHVAAGDQLSYLLFVHSASSLINFLVVLCAVFLVDKGLTAYKQKLYFRQALTLLALLCVAFLSELTMQFEGHELKVNEWNQTKAFEKRTNSNYLYLQEGTFKTVIWLKLTTLGVLAFAHLVMR